MKYKKTIILLALVVFLLSIAGVSASEIGDTIASEDTGVIELSHEMESANDNLGTSEEQTVTQTDNEKKTGETDDGSFEALKSKIESASSGDTVYLENNYSAEDSWTQDSGIPIYTSNLVIDGQGHTIDAKQKTKIFFIDQAENVTIKNIKFINAKINSQCGGAILWYEGANGSVSGCSFVNCSAGLDGGAIEWSHSDGGCVSGCSFVNCSAGNSGGAIDWYDSANGNISDCAFINNTDPYGRAIYISRSSASLDRNWFGNTAENYKTSPDAYIDGAGLDNWLFLNATVNPESIFITETADVIFKLYLYNGSITDYTSLAKVDLTLNSNGKLDKNVTGLDEKVTFTPTSPGTGSITATIGDVAYTKTLTVTTDGTTFWDLNQTINGNTNDTITLDKDYSFNPAYDTAFVNGIVINRPVTIKGNGNAIDAKRQARIFYVQSANAVLENLTLKNAHSNSEGGAVYFSGTGEVTNCNFTGNTATGDGGAVYFYVGGSVSNCNFTGNTASGDGGAINMRSGTVSNCNFADNKATGDYNYGGAVYFYRTGTVTNCNFTGNNATTGSAIYFYKWSPLDTLTVSNSTFLNNRANAEALDVVKNDNNITITFTGQNNLLNAIYSRNGAVVTFTNVTYWGADGITTVSATMSGSNKAAGQNITVKGVVNGKIIDKINGTDENGEIVLDDTGDYWIIVSHKGDLYYTEIAETLFTNMKLYANVTSLTTNNKTINITAKSNIYSEVMPGKLLFILSNGTQIEATYGANGTWWAEHTFDAYGEYKVNATYGLDNVAINNGTITINKVNSTITLDDIVLDYGESTNVTVTTTGATGITAKIDGNDVTVINNYNIQISGLKAGNHTLTVTTIPDDDHNPVTATSKITVNKVESTLTVDDIVFDYGSEGSGNVSFAGASEVIANVVSQPNAVVSVNGKKITVSGLAAGTYTLNVTTVPDENHTAVTETATITVNKVNSSLTLDDVELDYGESINVTVSCEGATGIDAKIDGVNVAVDAYTISISDLSAGTHTLTVATVPDENHTAVTKTATITVNKVSTNLTAAGVTATYKVNKYLIIKLTDGQGNPLANSTVTVDLNGVKNYTTDENGQIKIKVSNMVPKTYSAKISYAGNDNYIGSNATAKVVVKKATPKITASAKTFKTATKTKKYTITLKDNTGKAIKNAKVTLKVNGKTYKATTNSKGKATFKITKLTKKGTFKATITYTGNKYYNKVTKKANIKVISSWKTISKGSKDKSTVREIQQALKNHGYYLTAYGHYLMVDGVYADCTVRSVKEFQHDKGLKVTGKVDENTAKKLGLI